MSVGVDFDKSLTRRPERLSLKLRTLNLERRSGVALHKLDDFLSPKWVLPSRIRPLTFDQIIFLATPMIMYGTPIQQFRLRCPRGPGIIGNVAWMNQHDNAQSTIAATTR
jgi:hypothetical protein